MKTRLLLLFALALVVASCGKQQESSKQKYHCPMHPTYVSDRPGDCPICNMKLVPIKDSSSGHAGHSPNASATSAVPGRIAIAISPEKRQVIGLATSPVEARMLSRSIRIAATATHDETRLSRIAPRFGGWIQKLHINFTGQPVEKGEPVFTVYSPELFAAENEYLLLFRDRGASTNAAGGQAISTERLLSAARRRLELLGIAEEEIRALEQRNVPSEELVIRAPASGHVVTKNAVEGEAFTAGETLYEIADLSRIWLRGYVFEHDLPAIRVGQKAKVVFPNLQNASYESQVAFISPHLDPQTRRGEIRLELDNPNHALRPDMWADAEIELESGKRLSIPASAIIDTGARHIAFVAREDEHLEPREVKLGLRTDEYYEVLDGLKEGERVVTRALFLVDSESQLKAAISGMSGPAEHKH